jgi:uncharacterized membrane protein YdjX (TVP38/TMEM64 family)
MMESMTPTATSLACVPCMRRFAKLGLVAIVVTMLLVAYRFGVLAKVSEPQSLAHSLIAMGAWGYLLFLLAYTVLQPFGIPGTVFVVAAALIWPWPIAFALSMVGTMLASVVGFAFARFIARDWIAARIPLRFRKYDEALERNAFQTVVLLRIIFWMPPPLHAFFGVSRVPFWTHFWGSALGYLAPLFLVSVFGSRMFDSSGQLQLRALPILAPMLVISLGAAILLRRRSRASKKATLAPTTTTTTPIDS